MTLRIDCAYSSDWLSLGTQDAGVVEFVMSSPVEDSTLSVLLEDRAKVAELHRAMGDWLAAGVPSQGEALARWWGLSYASWLTVPRVLMQAMSAEWQERAGVLLAEYSAAFPNTPNYGTTVRATEPGGKLVAMPEWLNNYRHPKQAEIDKCRGDV